MTFIEAQEFIYSLMNLPRREYMEDPKSCGIYLERLQFFLDILKNPEKNISHYIHVTGTSGKGSVVNFLHNIIAMSGKLVASYISPHPSYITERFRIGGKIMSRKEFIELVKYIQPAIESYIRTSPYDMLSFFELNVAMALLYFSQKKVEWAIFEVGCGGRYDGTNILPHKEVAIITNIELDHMHILGNTKEKIAYEKAGIITPGTKVFTFEKNNKILSILKRECKKNKAISLTTTSPKKWPNIKLNCIGEHQKTNAALAATVALQLGIKKSTILRALYSTTQPARLEIISKKPYIILDSAHNKDKMKTTVKELGKIKNNTKKNINLLLGFSENKKWEEMINELLKLNPKIIICTRQTQNIFRTVVSPKDIETYIHKKNKKIKTKIFLDPLNAYNWIKKNTKKSDILLLTGSLFLSGEIRPWLTKK